MRETAWKKEEAAKKKDEAARRREAARSKGRNKMKIKQVTVDHLRDITVLLATRGDILKVMMSVKSSDGVSFSC